MYLLKTVVGVLSTGYDSIGDQAIFLDYYKMGRTWDRLGLTAMCPGNQ